MWLRVRVAGDFPLAISTHTSLVGCDMTQAGVGRSKHHFYSHIPCGMWLLIFFSCSLMISISTHTSLVGCDEVGEWLTLRIWQISTHTSLVGCDGRKISVKKRRRKFLLTHPLWDVTTSCRTDAGINSFLLTHPLWDVTISIVSPTELGRFLLTHPLWDVT